MEKINGAEILVQIAVDFNDIDSKIEDSVIVFWIFLMDTRSRISIEFFKDSQTFKPKAILLRLLSYAMLIDKRLSKKANDR